jgi:uncharacterized lipoprotein NlpE involved in copper resistance
MKKKSFITVLFATITLMACSNDKEPLPTSEVAKATVVIDSEKQINAGNDVEKAKLQLLAKWTGPFGL